MCSSVICDFCLLIYIEFNRFQMLTKYKIVPFCPYHFVQYHFVCIPFCPYHFVPYHFVQSPSVCYRGCTAHTQICMPPVVLSNYVTDGHLVFEILGRPGSPLVTLKSITLYSPTVTAYNEYIQNMHTSCTQIIVEFFL